MSLKIGVDIDGILAQFEGGFRRKLDQVRPGVIPATFDWAGITCWDWPQEQFGYSVAEVDAAWDLAKADPLFWVLLNPYPDAMSFLTRLRELALTEDYDVYFCTNRFGKRAKSQTEDWLSLCSWPDPTVLLVEGKGLMARALQLDYYIDDKVVHCEGVRAESPKTKGFMLARGWNKAVWGVPRLNSLTEFLAIIEEARHAHA